MSVNDNIIPLTLWYETESGRVELTQEELHLQEEPLVILGEAGIGKTELTYWLESQGGSEPKEALLTYLTSG